MTMGGHLINREWVLDFAACGPVGVGVGHAVFSVRPCAHQYPACSVAFPRSSCPQLVRVLVAGGSDDKSNRIDDVDDVLDGPLLDLLPGAVCAQIIVVLHAFFRLRNKPSVAVGRACAADHIGVGVFVGQMGIKVGAANVVFFVDVDSNAGSIADRKIGPHLQIGHERIFGRQPVFFPLIRIK